MMKEHKREELGSTHDMADRDLSLKDVEDRVRGLTELAGANLNKVVQEIILELVQLDVVPTAIAQVLKSLCNKANQHKQTQRALATQ